MPKKKNPLNDGLGWVMDMYGREKPVKKGYDAATGGGVLKKGYDSVMNKGVLKKGHGKLQKNELTGMGLPDYDIMSGKPSKGKKKKYGFGF